MKHSNRSSRSRFLITGASLCAAAVWPRRGAAQMLDSSLSPYRQRVTFAANLPLSGELAPGGIAIADGIRGAIEEANTSGGGFGTAFALRTFDDNGSLAQAITNVDFAMADDSIVVTIGGLTGSTTAASLPQYMHDGMPLIVPAATSDAVTAAGSPNVWRLATKESREGMLLAGMLFKRVRPASVLAVAQDGDYGAQIAISFADEMQRLGVPARPYIFPYDSPKYEAAARAILSAAPKYVVLCGKAADLGPIVPALRSAGYTGGFGASEGFYGTSALAHSGAALEGAFVSTSLPPLELAPDDVQQLVQFRRTYTVTPLSVFGYAAAQVAIAAARRSGALDRASMLAALRKPASYDTLVGRLRFDGPGDPVDANLYLYRIVAGQYKYVASALPTDFIL
jgi:ABC-type branched-subunit amino acid transport system substrate-binding protein